MSKNQNKTGREYLAEFKKTLKSKNSNPFGWNSLNNGGKSLLIRNAKLEKKFVEGDGFVRVRWDDIQPADQRKIKEAAVRAAGWYGAFGVVSL